jgi:Holliday junction resolvase-like predicted endonuclease
MLDFIEVRLRCNRNLGGAVMSIDHSKRERLAGSIICRPCHACLRRVSM